MTLPQSTRGVNDSFSKLRVNRACGNVCAHYLADLGKRPLLPKLSSSRRADAGTGFF